MSVDRPRNTRLHNPHQTSNKPNDSKGSRLTGSAIDGAEIEEEYNPEGTVDDISDGLDCFEAAGSETSSDVDDDDDDLNPTDIASDLHILAGKLSEQAKQKNQPGLEKMAIFLKRIADDHERAAANAPSSDAPPRLSVNATRASLLQRRDMLTQMTSVKRSGTLDSDSPEFHMIDSALQTLKAMDEVFRENITVPTGENIKAIGQALQMADESLSLMKKVADDQAYDSSRKSMWAKVDDEIFFRKSQLEAIAKEYSQYESPDSKKHRIDERLLLVNAAIKALEGLNRSAAAAGSGGTGNSAATDAQNFIGLLEKRRDTWRELREHPQLATVLATPADLPKRLAHGEEDAFTTVLLDDGQPEKVLMTAVIERALRAHPDAGSLSAKRLLMDAKAEVLNRERHWDVVACDIRVPLREAASVVAGSDERGVELATVKSVTTPIGHVFGHPDLVSTYKSSAFRNADMQDYLSADPSGTQRVNGVHSHSTVEHRHGVNVALTQLTDGDKTLFSATRHATLSAYELFPDTLRKKSGAMLRQMHADLCRTINRVTLLCTDQESAANAMLADEPAFTETGFDKLWNERTQGMTADQFIEKARNSESFCKLLRRKAALNRAREVFLGEVLGKPELLDRVRQGLPITFTSVSLITPDPLRHFLAKLFPWKFRMHDELNMRREELQAWKDLQESIDNGQLHIDQQPVKATVVSLCSAVNRIALSDEWGPLGRWLLSGWRQTERDNLAALQKLIGDPDQENAGGALGQHIQESLRMRAELETRRRGLEAAPSDNDKPSDEAKRLRDLLELQSKITGIDRHLEELKELRAQLTALWNSGEYRHAEAQPYKFAARLARMAHLIGGGIAFNCKSGKDRTAQLDLEVKLLSVQSTYRSEEPNTKLRADGSTAARTRVPGYSERSQLKLRQMQAFVFQDQTRLAMQRYNTGVEGSKLGWWDPLYYSFIAEGDDEDIIRRQYQGLMDLVNS